MCDIHGSIKFSTHGSPLYGGTSYASCDSFLVVAIKVATKTTHIVLTHAISIFILSSSAYSRCLFFADNKIQNNLLKLILLLLLSCDRDYFLAMKSHSHQLSYMDL